MSARHTPKAPLQGRGGKASPPGGGWRGPVVAVGAALLFLVVFWAVRKLVRNMKHPASHMNASPAGRRLVQRLEGLRLTAYLDQAGVPTIGYGHTGPTVELGQTVTRQEAEALFTADLAVAEAAVRTLQAELTQGQFDALVSFTYNVGAAAFQGSTLRRKVEADPADPGIPAEFRRWTYAGGAYSDGLANRREEEIRMYNS